MKRRKDGRWARDLIIDGRRHVFYSSAASEREAVRDIEHQMLSFREREEQGVSFAEAADAYDADCERRVNAEDLSPTTWYRYRVYLRRASEALGDRPVKALTAREVEAFLDGMKRKGFGTKTIKDQYSIIRQIVDFAGSELRAINDDIRRVNVPKGRKPVERDALTETEQKTVVDLISAPFGVYAALLLYTGLRRGELIGLQWADVDLDAGLISVRRNVVFTCSAPIVKEPKTEAGVRVVPIPEPLRKILQPLEGRPAEYVVSGEALRPNRWYTRRWKEWQTATGLTVTPHQFRHTYATMLYEAGVDELSAQKIMGHADIETTRKIYTHLRDEKLAEGIAKIKNFLS